MWPRHSHGPLDGRNTKGKNRDCRIAYDAPLKGVPPGPPKRWLEEAEMLLTPAASWDDRVHNFVSPGLQVLGATFKPRGLTACPLASPNAVCPICKQKFDLPKI